MEKLKTYLVSKQAKTIYWQIANLLILLFAGFVTETGFYPIFLSPLLNTLTRYINKNYL